MLYRIIVSLFGFIGIAWGYHVQQFSQTVLVLTAGFALAALVCPLNTARWFHPLYNIFDPKLFSAGNYASLANLPATPAQVAETSSRASPIGRGFLSSCVSVRGESQEEQEQINAHQEPAVIEMHLTRFTCTFEWTQIKSDTTIDFTYSFPNHRFS